jgi:hypothetical protein
MRGVPFESHLLYHEYATATHPDGAQIAKLGDAAITWVVRRVAVSYSQVPVTGYLEIQFTPLPLLWRVDLRTSEPRVFEFPRYGLYRCLGTNCVITAGSGGGGDVYLTAEIMAVRGVPFETHPLTFAYANTTGGAASFEAAAVAGHTRRLHWLHASIDGAPASVVEIKVAVGGADIWSQKADPAAGDAYAWEFKNYERSNGLYKPDSLGEAMVVSASTPGVGKTVRLCGAWD